MWAAGLALIGLLTAACILQMLVILSLITQTRELRGQVCHIAVIQHVVVIGCHH